MTVFEKIKVADLEEMTGLFIAFGAKMLYDIFGEEAAESYVDEKDNYLSIQKWLESEAE